MDLYYLGKKSIVLFAAKITIDFATQIQKTAFFTEN